MEEPKADIMSGHVVDSDGIGEGLRKMEDVEVGEGEIHVKDNRKKRREERRRV